MLSILIDAKELRDVATVDVSGAYLHAEMKDFTLLKMEDEPVDIMCNLCGDYEKIFMLQKRQKDAVPRVTEGLIWLRTIRFTFRRVILQHPARNGF
jgi:hypothetical protein